MIPVEDKLMATARCGLRGGAQNKEPGATCAEVGEGVACYIQGGKKSSRVIWKGCKESGDREKEDWRIGETEV